MPNRNLVRISILILITLICYSCPHIELPGEIIGIVTDAETSGPLVDASVKLYKSNLIIDSTQTQINGIYNLKNISPGIYEIQASKFSYYADKEPVEVISAETQIMNFDLDSIPLNVISVSDTHLDFWLDVSSLSFTISNRGAETSIYNIKTSQDWISVNPKAGEINETDTITVTVDRTGLPDCFRHKESVSIRSFVGQDEIPEIKIDIYLIGAYDPHTGDPLSVAKIGTQIWMTKNLNVGNYINPYNNIQSDNGIVEKYCQNNDPKNCDIYGGLYTWDEMMQYGPPENNFISTTQGICPANWHIPTLHEWMELITYVGGYEVAGCKLKERGYIHWKTKNDCATDEYGFTLLPAGTWGHRTWNPSGEFNNLNINTDLWTTSSSCGGSPTVWCRIATGILGDDPTMYNWEVRVNDWLLDPELFAISVRCLMNQ